MQYTCVGNTLPRSWLQSLTEMTLYPTKCSGNLEMGLQRMWRTAPQTEIRVVWPKSKVVQTPRVPMYTATTAVPNTHERVTGWHACGRPAVHLCRSPCQITPPPWTMKESQISNWPTTNGEGTWLWSEMVLCVCDWVPSGAIRPCRKPRGGQCCCFQTHFRLTKEQWNWLQVAS